MGLLDGASDPLWGSNPQVRKHFCEASVKKLQFLLANSYNILSTLHFPLWPGRYYRPLLAYHRYIGISLYMFPDMCQYLNCFLRMGKLLGVVI